MFTSGENGHVPEGETNDISDELWRLYTPTGADVERDWDPDRLCSELGLYSFDYSEEFDPIAPYIRYIVPESPLKTPSFLDRVSP